MNDAMSWNELLRRSDWEGREQRYSEALKLAREALEWAKREFGEESFEVAETWGYIAKAASFNQDEAVFRTAQEAENQIRKVLAPRTFVPDPKVAASGLIYLANRLFLMFVEEKAHLDILQAALTFQERVFGPDHPRVGYTAAHIGDFYANIGQPRASFPFYERGLDILQKTLGPLHVDVAAVLDNLSGALVHAANLDLGSKAPNPVTDPSQYSVEIHALFEKSLACRSRARSIREHHGMKDETMYYILLGEAQVLKYLGRAAEASLLEKRARPD